MHAERSKACLHIIIRLVAERQCVCTCVRENEREREREGVQMFNKMVREREDACTCLFACTSLLFAHVCCLHMFVCLLAERQCMCACVCESERERERLLPPVSHTHTYMRAHTSTHTHTHTRSHTNMHTRALTQTSTGGCVKSYRCEGKIAY